MPGVIPGIGSSQTARANLNTAKRKLQELIDSGQDCIEQRLPHGVMERLTRVDLEKAIADYEYELQWHEEEAVKAATVDPKVAEAVARRPSMVFDASQVKPLPTHNADTRPSGAPMRFSHHTPNRVPREVWDKFFAGEEP